jgi:hypothetical protein
MPTLQEAFDTVCEHFADQKERALIDGDCAYRGDNGLQCGVGCLIPDSQYEPYFDNMSTPLLEVANKVPALRGLPFSFLRDVQDAHDDCEEVEYLTTKLTELAGSHFLDAAKVALITEWK